MKYMILLYGNQQSWDDMAKWSQDDIQAMVRFMDDVNNDLTAAGELVEAQGLAGPADTKTVRARNGGGPSVKDGPLSDTDDVLAGYWVVDVATPDRALEIAARVSASPGPGGQPSNDPIEVRPVMDAPDT